MLRAGLGRRRCRCGGLWGGPCPAAAGCSASPRCPGALRAAFPSNGGGARSGGAPPAGSRAAPSSSAFPPSPRWAPLPVRSRRGSEAVPHAAWGRGWGRLAGGAGAGGALNTWGMAPAAALSQLRAPACVRRRTELRPAGCWARYRRCCPPSLALRGLGRWVRWGTGSRRLCSLGLRLLSPRGCDGLCTAALPAALLRLWRGSSPGRSGWRGEKCPLSAPRPEFSKGCRTLNFIHSSFFFRLKKNPNKLLIIYKNI